MFTLLQLVTVILAAVAMVPALAHALELPGKMRLTREAYMAVQPIYYPGFTLAGLSEPGAILATILLLFMAEPGSTDFWLTLAASVALVVMHAVYWFRTHPVNNFWLQDEKLGKAGTSFFTAMHADGDHVRLRQRTGSNCGINGTLAFAARDSGCAGFYRAVAGQFSSAGWLGHRQLDQE